jgi:recombination protein RecR
MFPKSVVDLIDQLAKLPEIGPRAATRLVFFLLEQDQKELNKYAILFRDLKRHTRLCQQCFNIAQMGQELCPICLDKKRDASVICVVENILDILPIEKTRLFNGTYHVLGGLLSPMDNVGPADIRIKQLLQRIKNHNIKEVILALNPTTEGDTTSLYLQKELNKINVKVTRLARGLSVGSDLEYVDENTLSSALQNRK